MSARVAWLLGGGLACGFGIWATHFIAMLGYDPGVIGGYRPDLTIGSLGIVLAATMAGLTLAADGKRAHVAASAIITGAGFAAMHYLGMAALQMPAEIRWDRGLVAVSLALAILPLYPALRFAVGKQGLASGAAAAGTMTAAIVGLHFSGMAAIRLVPAAMPADAVMLSRQEMSLGISGASLLLLGLCIAAWIVSRRTNAALSASRRQFSILVKGISDCAIYMLDTSGRVASWNTGAERLKGYEQSEIVGRSLDTFYTAEDRAVDMPRKVLGIALSTGKYSGEGWRVRQDGSRFWAHVTIERIEDQDGQLAGFAKITRDMTQFKDDQDRIEATRRQLDMALENMHQGLALFDADERLVLSNRRLGEIWNLEPDQLRPGTSLVDLARTALESRTGAGITQARLEAVCEQLREAVHDSGSMPIVSEFGEHFAVSIASRAMPEGGWVATYEDVTERKRSEARITHLAHHDVLTGLPNRASFNGWLDREIAEAERAGHGLAVVAVDLDGFKDVNDNHGHAMGDAVLARLGNALGALTGPGQTTARLGGDEFAIATQVRGSDELEEFVRRIEACFAPDAGDVDAIPVSASIGIAVYPADAGDRDSLLNNADLAMYRAKGDPAGSVCYYERGMDELARRRRQLGTDLRQAIARGELQVLYQEQRLIATKELSGYEALLRWHHPTFGTVSPVEFIPIAEETGEIIRIGAWVLRNACADAATWPTNLTLAVNLSPVQLLMPDLPEQVAQILVQTEFSPRRLELEITESAIIADKVRALHSLRRIKALGVNVAMDDFGTGYSSLDTLHSFPFDKIKIDKSFLQQSGQSEQARAIIRAVLALGKSLQIPVLAEGVETEAQLSLLVKEGCHAAQGYLFGKPALLERLPARMRKAI